VRRRSKIPAFDRESHSDAPGQYDSQKNNTYFVGLLLATVPGEGTEFIIEIPIAPKQVV
jgi:hypothetical protein